MFNNLFFVIFAYCWLAVALLPQSLMAGTVHAILVGDTLSTDISYSILADLNHMSKQVKLIAEQTQMELKTTLLQGQEVSLNAIVEAINGADIGGDDLVVFFFSGHGFRNQIKPDRWPYLYFTPLKEGLNFHEINQLALAKHPRLLISIADCCNNYTSNVNLQNHFSLFEKAIPFNLVKENYKKLFLNYSGTVIVSGAIPGKYSYSSLNDGGIYTIFFLKGLTDAIYRGFNPNWNTLMENVSKQVLNLQRVGLDQTPQFEITGSAMHK